MKLMDALIDTYVQLCTLLVSISLLSITFLPLVLKLPTLEPSTVTPLSSVEREVR